MRWMSQIVYVNAKNVAAREIYPGLRKRVLWQCANGAKAQILEIDAGASFLTARATSGARPEPPNLHRTAAA
jgi:hypothetical protein